VVFSKKEQVQIIEKKNSKLKSLEQRIAEAMSNFESYYLFQVMQYKERDQKGDTMSIFAYLEDYLQSCARGLYSELIKRSKKEGISLSECVYHSLTGDLKDRWEIVLNLTDSRYEDANEMAKEKSVREFIEHVLPLKETQEFKEDLVPYLSQEQLGNIVGKIGNMLYQKLNDKQRELLNAKTITRHLLGLGYLTFNRSSHKKAVGFIKKYAPCFKGEQDVVFSILERYVDEELARTPIEDTQKRVMELKIEVEALARGIS